MCFCVFLFFAFVWGMGDGGRVVGFWGFSWFLGVSSQSTQHRFFNDYIDVGNNFKRKNNNSGSSTVIHLDR